MIRSLLPAALVAILAQSSAGETVVISDGIFDPADYETQLDGSSANLGRFSSPLTQIPIGGNPGAFLQVDLVGQDQAGPTERVQAWHFNTAQPYDPANGAILSLDYSEDSIRIARAAPLGALALRQDGILFRSEASFPTGTSNSSFTNNQLTEIVAEDFQAFLNGTFFPTANPDFTESGSPIEFGFYRFASNAFGVNDSTGIDNWTVTLTTEAVPEPSSLLLVCGMLAMSGRVWRR